VPATPQNKRKIGRNDPCWCGSEKKYKKCHQNREFKKPLPVEALEGALRTAWHHKECLHPLALHSVCNRIVSAHSVQRSQTLEQILDAGNHVCSFYPQANLPDGRLKLHRIGWREASTFTGFCAKHDATTFAPLDNIEFSGSAEQCFLIGYRALCHEIYQKSGALKADPIIRQMVDRGLPLEAQLDIQEMFAIWGAGTAAGLQDFRRLKAVMDNHLLAHEYSGWSRAIIRFTGPLCIASTGALSPNRTIDGAPLQALHALETPIEELPFGVVAAPKGGAVVFLWRPHEQKPRQFVESLLKNETRMLAGLLVQFMFAYVENTYFSVQWWESLSEFARQHLNALAAISNPYYTPFQYLPLKLVPWEITSASIENASVAAPSG
jgi:hypothetical protein